MGYDKIYLKRGVALGALVGLTTASSLALILGLGISGIAGTLILQIAEIVGVPANSVFVLPPNQVVESVVETGTPQLIGLQIALSLYFILRLAVDWIRTRGGTSDVPGVTFSNSLKESLRLTVVNMVKIGVPLSILVFCGTTYAGLTFYKMGNIGSESLLIVIIQSLTLTPMLLFMQIGAEALFE